MTENNLGNLLLQQGRLEEAAQHYEAALSARKQLLAGDPDSVTYQSYVAATQNNLAGLFSRQGRLEEAAQHYQAALSARKQLLAGDPGSTTYQSDVAVTESNLGNLLSAQGRLAEAAQHHQRSLGLYAGLYGRDPSNTIVARRLAEVGVNFAGLRIQTGQTTDGVEGLKQAAFLFLNAGWSDGVGAALGRLAPLVGHKDAEPSASEAALAFAANASSTARKQLVDKLPALPDDASSTAHVLLELLRADLAGKSPRERAAELFESPPAPMAPLANFVRSVLAGREPQQAKDVTPWEHLLRLHLAMLLSK